MEVQYNVQQTLLRKPIPRVKNFDKFQIKKKHLMGGRGQEEPDC